MKDPKNLVPKTKITEHIRGCLGGCGEHDGLGRVSVHLEAAAAGAAVVAGAGVVAAPQSPGPLLQVLHSWMGSRYSVSRKQEVGDSVSLGKK